MVSLPAGRRGNHISERVLLCFNRILQQRVTETSQGYLLVLVFFFFFKYSILLVIELK